jgi:hypothetical protein
VYTRKSSEEGLEQDFNSLHAQREACEAYIRSQQGEGWKLIATAYDDGGLSGGTLQRPALQQLLKDIAQGACRYRRGLHLRRVLSAYFEYHHRSRTHLSLGKDCPEPRSVQPPSAGTVVAFPQVGGLHHRYERRAA